MLPKPQSISDVTDCNKYYTINCFQCLQAVYLKQIKEISVSGSGEVTGEKLHYLTIEHESHKLAALAEQTHNS